MERKRHVPRAVSGGHGLWGQDGWTRCECREGRDEWGSSGDSALKQGIEPGGRGSSEEVTAGPQAGWEVLWEVGGPAPRTGLGTAPCANRPLCLSPPQAKCTPSASSPRTRPWCRGSL